MRHLEELLQSITAREPRTFPARVEELFQTVPADLIPLLIHGGDATVRWYRILHLLRRRVPEIADGILREIYYRGRTLDIPGADALVLGLMDYLRHAKKT